MAIDSQQTTSKFRWVEIDEDDDLDFLLPPKEVIGPDKNGLMTTIQYKFKREGEKFEEVADEESGRIITMRLERPRVPVGPVPMICTICGKEGDHWTLDCPLQRPGQLAATTTYAVIETSVDGSTSVWSMSTNSAPPGTSRTTYVPPSMIAGADSNSAGSDMRRRNNENSVRVTNLSEDTREQDLMELVRPFGAGTRAYVSIDQNTGVSQGFGFISFMKRERPNQQSTH